MEEPRRGNPTGHDHPDLRQARDRTLEASAVTAAYPSHRHIDTRHPVYRVDWELLNELRSVSRVPVWVIEPHQVDWDCEICPPDRQYQADAVGYLVFRGDGGVIRRDRICPLCAHLGVAWHRAIGAEVLRIEIPAAVKTCHIDT